MVDQFHMKGSSQFALFHSLARSAPPLPSQSTMAAKGVYVKEAHTEGRGSLVYTPDGRCVRHRREHYSRARSHLSAHVRATAFSHMSHLSLSRRYVLTAGADTFVKVFDADNLTAEPRTIEHHDDAVTALAIDPKGKHIATGTASHLASYFKFPACEFEKHLARAQSPVQHVAFDSKGRTLAVGADDGVIRLAITNVPTGQQGGVALLKGHTDAVLCVAFDPRGEYLASSSADGTVRIWDISDEPTTVKTVRIATRVQPGSSQRLRVAWHPSGSSLAIPYLNGVQLLERGTWSVETTAMVGGHSKEVSLVAWSRNGQYFATAGLDRQVFVWQRSTSESLDRYKADAVPTDLAWSPRDNALAFVDEQGQLGNWRSVVPSHLPSPVGEDIASTTAAAAAEAALNAPPPPMAAAPRVEAPAPTGAAAPSAPSAGGSAAETTMFSLGQGTDDIMADDLLDAAVDAAEAAGGGGGGGGSKRRLRKVAHDSDDGGFSDHDDDEAAEAALLAAEIAKKTGAHGKAAAQALVAAGGSHGGTARGALAALSAAAALSGGAPLQEVLHSSATPAKNGRRFLLWNMTGMVLSRDETVYSAIEVEFNSTDKHRTVRLTDHYGFSMAALDDTAVMFASRSGHGNPSTIVYRPLASWAPNSEWQVQLDKGEETLAIALGHKFAAIATSHRYLRILSHTGAQRSTICIAGPLVALAAHGGVCAVVTHLGRAAGSTDQSMQLSLYDLRETSRPVRMAAAPVPLSEGATLRWLGFSESGVLSSVDSAGLVRSCLRSYNFEWVPVLDTNTIKKSKSEHHWVVGLTDKDLLAVLCKADDPAEAYPATLPRPLVTNLALQMPLACTEPAEPAIERERLLGSLMLNEYRASAADNGTDQDDVVQEAMVRGFTKLDASILKLMASACKHERNARALDLALELKLPKSLQGALKLANHYKLGPLADRISKLMEARFADGDEEMDAADVEEAPAAPPRMLGARPAAAPPAAPAAAAPAPAPMRSEQQKKAAQEEDADDEHADDDGAHDAPRVPLNPFGKANAASKAAAEATSKGPKRTLPVTAVGAKKSKA